VTEVAQPVRAELGTQVPFSGDKLTPPLQAKCTTNMAELRVEFFFALAPIDVANKLFRQFVSDSDAVRALSAPSGADAPLAQLARNLQEGASRNFYQSGDISTEAFKKAVDELIDQGQEERLSCFQRAELTSDENMEVDEDVDFTCNFECESDDQEPCRFVFISYVAPVADRYAGAFPPPLEVKRKGDFLTFTTYQPGDGTEGESSTPDSGGEADRDDAAAFACASYSLALFAIFV